jgi:hypothetical protein
VLIDFELAHSAYDCLHCTYIWRCATYSDGATVPIKQGLCGSTAASNTVLNTVDCVRDPRYDPLYDSTSTCIDGSRDSSSVVCMPVPPPVREASMTRSDLPINDAVMQSACTTATAKPPMKQQELTGIDKARSVLQHPDAIATDQHMSATSASGSCSSYSKPMAHKPSLLKSTDASTAPLRPHLLRHQTTAKGSSLLATVLHETIGRACFNATSCVSAAAATESRHYQHCKGSIRCAPIAVLQVCDKRGSEAFELSDEMRLEVLCTEINELLRSRLVEVSLT